jgi:hypothetical protein
MKKSEATAAMLADLARSGLEPKHMQAALVGAAELATMFPKARAEWAYKLPYPPRMRKGLPAICRFKVLHYAPGAFGEVATDAPKYLQPPATAPGAYFYGGYDWSVVCSTPGAEIILVEGEKKAACGCLNGFNVIGLGGVWSWKSKTLGLSFLPELAAIDWHGRHVYLCFDSDTVTNADVARALVELTKKLTSMGALVHEATIPEVTPGEKAGLDDFIQARGPEAFRKLLDDASTRVGEAVEKLWSLNTTHAIIKIPTMVLEEDVPDANGKLENRFHKWHDWSSVVMADRSVMDLQPGGQGRPPKAVQVPLSKLWNEWPARRCFSQVTYMPGQPRILNHGSVYNGWRALGVEPKKGSVKLWKELLAFLFDGSPPEHVKWFEQWLGYPLKHLGTKMASAVGMWGAQGVGKSLIPLVTMGPIYGRNFTSVKQPELESEFNDWATDRQLVLIDEVEAENSKHRGALLKHLITSPRMFINRKGLPRYEVPDYINYYLASNSPRAFDLDEDDRRFFVHKVLADRSQFPRDLARAYCDEWLGRVSRSDVYTGKGHAALLHYFLHELDYTGFQHDQPPMTRAKRDMVEVGRHPAVDWLLTFTERDTWAKYMRREVWTPSELCTLYRGSGNRSAENTSVNGFGAYLSTVGCPRWHGTVKGESVRFVAVTNFEKWKKATADEWVKEYQRVMLSGVKF